LIVQIKRTASTELFQLRMYCEFNGEEGMRMDMGIDMDTIIELKVNVCGKNKFVQTKFFSFPRTK
jgi:hypothetical protein